MSNNTASSVVFHDANEFAVYELSRATCPVLSLSVPYFSGTPVVVTGHQHWRQGTRKTKLSDLARLTTYQLSATVSHFVSTRTLHITFLSECWQCFPIRFQNQT
jgi:hypothetical protein